MKTQVARLVARTTKSKYFLYRMMMVMMIMLDGEGGEVEVNGWREGVKGRLGLGELVIGARDRAPLDLGCTDLGFPFHPPISSGSK